MPGMHGTGITIDEYILHLTRLKAQVGGLAECWTDGGSDYPEAAIGPCLQVADEAYIPKGVVVLR